LRDIPCERIRRFGIGQVNRDGIAIIGQRSPDQKIATLDHNSTIVESWKLQATKTCQG
jgi:hypothetical protein